MSSGTSPDGRAGRRWRLAKWSGVVLASGFAFVALVVVSGAIPVPASSGHWAITSWLLHFTMQRSVATHSLGIQTPNLDQPRLVLLGAGHYDGGCRLCHGSPGSRMPRVAQASTPPAPPLSSHLASYDDAELFYIVRHGIKFTGMPAWPAQGRDDEVWALVAFLRALPALDAGAYRALVHGGDDLYATAAPPVVATKCARCHGAHGLGREHGAFPQLAGQKPLYLTQSMQAYARGSRHSGIMEPIAAALSADELREAVAWYAAQAPRLVQTDATRGLPSGVGERLPLCEACHADDDRSHAAFPRLTGQHPAYLEEQLALLARKERGGGPYLELMETVVHWLSDHERRLLARHFGRAVE